MIGYLNTIFIIIALYLVKVTYFSQLCFEINATDLGLIEIMTIKLTEYRANFVIKSKIRRFIWCMIRLMNFSVMNTLFRGDSNWASPLRALWFAIPLSLIFTFFPEKLFEKYYSKNYLLRLLFICEINQIFIFGYFRTMELYFKIYDNNTLMWIIAIFIADGYATCGPIIAEAFVMDWYFKTYSAIMNIIYYLVPTAAGYIFLNVYGHTTNNVFVASPKYAESDRAIWISTVWFMGFGFFDCWYSGLFELIAKQMGELSIKSNQIGNGSKQKQD